MQARAKSRQPVRSNFQGLGRPAKSAGPNCRILDLLRMQLLRPTWRFDGHVWTPIVSSGDVAVMVSRLRQRALVTGPMDEDRGLTWAINWDDWHESLRSDLLRRAEAARHHPDASWLCRRAPAAMRLPWPTWLHQPSPRRVQSSMALSRARLLVLEESAILIATATCAS